MTARTDSSHHGFDPHIPVPDAGTAAWYHREQSLPAKQWKVRCIFSNDHADGTLVVDPGDVDGRFVLWQADLDTQHQPRIRVNPLAISDAPTLWFVGLPETKLERPAMTLVAYEAPVIEPGVVVPDTTFFGLPIRSRDQVGAIRWWSEEGVVDQVYVGEDWRRRHVATALIYAASAYHQLRGWPGRLHSDGRRTELGGSLVAGLRHPSRIAVLEKLMPPMDEP